MAIRGFLRVMSAKAPDCHRGAPNAFISAFEIRTAIEYHSV